MIIFFQELVLLLFLWLLGLIDGLMELFSGISGVTDVMLNGERVNIIDALAGDSTVAIIFWCIFILAIGLSCIFAIVAFIKNMISNNRNVSSIVGKLLLSLLGTMAMVAVVFLGILISNSTLRLISEIFEIGNTTKLSNMIFEACVGKWVNGYSISEINVTSLSVYDIFGDYNATLFGIWPTSWKCNGMVDPNSFMYLPALIASIGVMISLIIAILNLAKRVYEIIFMYIVMPLSTSTISLDDGARFKTWRETFVSKILIAYGSVFSVNIFILLLPIITKMTIPGISGFGNSIFKIFMIIGGCMIIPAGQMLFARLFGQAEDMHAGGSFLRSAFYGGRIASALTFGAAAKMVKGTVGIGKKAVGAIKKKSGSKNSSSGGDDDPSDRYVEPDSGGGSEATEGEGESQAYSDNSSSNNEPEQNTDTESSSETSSSESNFGESAEENTGGEVYTESPEESSVEETDSEEQTGGEE